MVEIAQCYVRCPHTRHPARTGPWLREKVVPHMRPLSVAPPGGGAPIYEECIMRESTVLRKPRPNAEVLPVTHDVTMVDKFCVFEDAGAQLSKLSVSSHLLIHAAYVSK
jgi:hypothetical protein